MTAQASGPDRRLLIALEPGLALVPRPYGELARRVSMSEEEVVARLARLEAVGVIGRFGVVVRHRELGYRANAMVVWDVPDQQVGEAGRRLAALPFVSLCYRRPRRGAQWPYNLFAMIHGHSRETVLAQVAEAKRAAGLEDLPHEVLFSRRRFKQKGASYRARGKLPGEAA